MRASCEAQPGPVAIRRAEVSEKDVLEALQWRASLANPGDRDILLAHPDAIDLPLDQLEHGQVLVAEVASCILGFAAIVWRDDGDAELDALFVEPGHWRRGLGRTLVEHCCSAARMGGAASMHVVGNPHAETFYAACGFTRSGTRATRFGPGLLMRRDFR